MGINKTLGNIYLKFMQINIINIYGIAKKKMYIWYIIIYGMINGIKKIQNTK